MLGRVATPTILETSGMCDQFFRGVMHLVLRGVLELIVLFMPRRSKKMIRRRFNPL